MDNSPFTNEPNKAQPFLGSFQQNFSRKINNCDQICLFEWRLLIIIIAVVTFSSFAYVNTNKWPTRKAQLL